MGACSVAHKSGPDQPSRLWPGRCSGDRRHQLRSELKMTMRSLRSILSSIAGAMMLLVSSAAAQQQVDPRIIQPVGGGAPVDTRVGKELYGNNESSSVVYYPHQV